MALEPGSVRGAAPPPPSAVGRARPDEPTGGKLVLKKSAEWEVPYHSTGKRAATDTPSVPARGRRRCRACRPLLFLAAPLLLVVVFVLRIQRGSTLFTSAGVLAGNVATLDARPNGDKVLLSVTIRPGGRLTSFFLREPPAEPGTPVAVFLSAVDGAEKPTLLYGETPGRDMPSSILTATIRPGRSDPPTFRADVSIAGKTISLYRVLDSR